MYRQSGLVEERERGWETFKCMKRLKLIRACTISQELELKVVMAGGRIEKWTTISKTITPLIILLHCPVLGPLLRDRCPQASA